MIRRCFLLNYAQSIESCSCGLLPLSSRRGKTSNTTFADRTKLQIEKAFVRNQKLRKKFYDNDDTSLVAFSKPLVPHSKSSVRKLNSRILLRERIVSNLLKNEVQNLIDAGELGEEVRSLNLTLTRASMNSFNVCQVFWEPVMSSKDLEISETLNKLSGSIRHMLIVNHIMNNVPAIHFYMDPASRRAALVERVFENEDLDVGDEESAERSDEDDFRPSELFGLNQKDLFSKLTILKKSNKVDKS